MVGIERPIVNPEPGLRLLPGDLLVLLGSGEQMKRAMRVLEEMASRAVD